MKKLSLLIGGLLFSGLIMAQAGDVKGTITLEGQTNIGGVVPGKRLAPSARFRYFASEKLALRGTFGLSNVRSTREFFSTEANNTGDKGTYTYKTTSWNLAVGAEWHVAGTERVSPYIAVDFVYGGGKRIIDAQNANTNSYVANYSRDAELPITRIGGAMMGGLDYNFSPAFFMGFEIGVQVTAQTTGEGEVTTTTGSTTVTSMSNKTQAGTATDLIAAVRLGFRF